MDSDFLETRNRHLDAKYELIKKNEQRAETFMTEDADIILMAYGIMARVSKKSVLEARKQGVKAGLIRPITLWPFPENIVKEAAQTAKRFLSIEISMGQMIEDIRLVVAGQVPVDLYGRIGITPNPEEITKQIIALADREGLR